MSNQFFTIQENYRERFFQLPKVFFTNPKYMKIKNVSKIAYAILQDRLQLSIKNKWVDEDGRIYFVYTDKKLMDILNISKNHVTTVKKELKEVGLLIQKRQGLNKPNISYLLKPEVTSDDIYKIETQENDVKPSHIKDSHTVGTNDTEFNDTEFNDTTTSSESSSGSSNLSKWIHKIKLEFNIPITTTYQNELNTLLPKFDDEVIDYAIQYASKHGNNPKVFFLKVLQNWSDKGIKTLNEAKNYNIKKPNNIKSKELTPDWLKNPDQTQSKQMTPEEKAEFEREREVFRRQLNELWGE